MLPLLPVTRPLTRTSQVLLDGNFLHACVCLKYVWPPPVRCESPCQASDDGSPLLFRLGDVREAVAKLLGAQVRVFVTKCVQAELHALGADYSGVCLFLLQQPRAWLALLTPLTCADTLW